MLAAPGPTVKLSPGDLIEQKYQIVRVLGTGGMGSVYEATNLRVGRRVAIKVMHKVRDQVDVARFEREARAAQIGSPHIVQVHDLGYLEDGAPYMVMEYLAGESLGQRVHRQGSLRPSELVPIVKQVLEALVAAHRVGIVHRDLKPDNVFLSRPEGETREVVKLVDFGISKFIDNNKKVEELSLTRTGVAVGTPHYMSPEQVQSKKELDARSDIYSLGVMIYRCLSGQLPFNAESVGPLLVRIVVDVPPPLRELVPELDRELVKIVTRSMSRQPEDRFQTAGEFLDTLVAWEKTRAANLDAPLIPVGTTAVTRTGPHGTAASWSSVAEVSTHTGQNFRKVALTVSFSIAGIVGLLVALKLWSVSSEPMEQVVTSASVTAATTSANAAQLRPPTSPQVLVVPVVTGTTEPTTVAPQVVTTAARPVHATAVSARSDRSPIATKTVEAATAVLSAAVPTPPVPAVAPPVISPKLADVVEQSDRHVLEDL